MAQTQKKQGDMGTGSVKKLLLQLMIPAVVAQIVNLLYNIVDRIYIGHIPGIGAAALTGVGLFTPILMLLNAFAMLIGAGGAPRTAIAMGQGDKDQAEKIVSNSFTMLLIFSVLLTVVFYAAAPALLRMFGASDATLPYALAYSRIYILGSVCVLIVLGMNPFITAQGFAKISMLTTVIGAVINIVLDPILIFLFGLGVRGAAIATVLSQLLSGGLCAYWFFARTAKLEGLSFRQPRTLLSAGHCRRLAYIGLPMGFEYSVSAIGAVIMQDAINLLGSTAVAAQTAGEKIRQMFTLPMESVGMAMATYVGQNHGAGRTDRVRQGIRDGCIIQAGYSAIAWVAVFLVKRWAVGLVLGDAEPAIFNGAVEYLTVISVLFVLLGFLMIFRYTLQGLGYSVQAVISGVGELIGRALGGWLAVHQLGYLGICISNPLAWGFALCYCVFMVTRVLKKESRAA